jgi:hypothetical protein
MKQKSLVALVPKPWANLPRFHGVFAPNSGHRAQVAPAKRGKGKKARTAGARTMTRGSSIFVVPYICYDTLNDSEPWSWMQPPRHALGALLLEQVHLDETAAVYRADLGLDDTSVRPDNVWSLHG